MKFTQMLFLFLSFELFVVIIVLFLVTIGKVDSFLRMFQMVRSDYLIYDQLV